MIWGFILHTTKANTERLLFKLLVLTGVTEDDYMSRMEVVYCVACDIHIPVVFSSVQQHLHSLTHLKSKVVTWLCPHFSIYPEPSFSSYIWDFSSYIWDFSHFACMSCVFFLSKAYKEQLKRDSVVTAKAIINNENVKLRYEKYMKVMTFVAYWNI